MQVTICKDEKSAITHQGDRRKVVAIEISKADRRKVYYGPDTSLFKVVMAKNTVHSAYIDEDDMFILVKNPD